MQYEITVAESHDQKIEPEELAQFLLKLKAAYVLALRFVAYRENIDPGYDKIPTDKDRRFDFPEHRLEMLQQEFYRYVEMHRGVHTTTRLLKMEVLPNQALEFTRITTNSPLKFMGYATGVGILALSLAVSLAGGKANLKELTFEVQPMAEAIVHVIQAIDR